MSVGLPMLSRKMDCDQMVTSLMEYENVRDILDAGTESTIEQRVPDSGHVEIFSQLCLKFCSPLCTVHCLSPRVLAANSNLPPFSLQPHPQAALQLPPAVVARPLAERAQRQVGGEAAVQAAALVQVAHRCQGESSS